jgi:hypothetical protein
LHQQIIEEASRFYIWNSDLCGIEILTHRKVVQKYLESFKM